MAQQVVYEVVANVGPKKPVKHNVVCRGEPAVHGAEIRAALAPEYKIHPNQVELLSVSPELPDAPKARQTGRKGGQADGGSAGQSGENPTGQAEAGGQGGADSTGGQAS